MSVNLQMLSLLRKAKTLWTLSSYTWHLSSTVFRYCDTAADISNSLQLSLICTLYLGPCSKCNNFAKINPQSTKVIISSFYNDAFAFGDYIHLNIVEEWASLTPVKVWGGKLRHWNQQVCISIHWGANTSTCWN